MPTAYRTNSLRSKFRRSPCPRERRWSASRSLCATPCNTICITARTRFAPTYQLKVVVSASQFTAYLDPTTGRPNTQISSVNASFQLIELATGKTAVSDSTFAHVDYDIPGSQQRFAGQRAHRDAEGHAVQVVAEAIDRLASYFVAGT